MSPLYKRTRHGNGIASFQSLSDFSKGRGKDKQKRKIGCGRIVKDKSTNCKNGKHNKCNSHYCKCQCHGLTNL